MAANAYRPDTSCRGACVSDVPSILLAVALTAVLAAQSGAAGQAGSDEQAVADFQKRIAGYLDLHRKFAPSPQKEAAPLQISEAHDKLTRGIIAARASAKPGDIFRPAMQSYVRRALTKAFSAPDGKALRASILDENPIGTPIRINAPYPDEIPLSTMPPKVLEALPKLPPNLEYRFVGERMILFDSLADLVVDYVDRALPRL